MPVPPSRTAARPSAPARPAAATSRAPARRPSFFADFKKSAEKKQVERLPNVNCGDSQSNPSTYVVHLTDLSFFTDRENTTVFCKLLGRIAHSVDGYSGEVEFDGKRPDWYGKAQKAGAGVTVLFYDLNKDKKWGYNRDEFVMLMQRGLDIEQTNMPALFSAILQYAEFAEGTEDIREMFLAALDEACSDAGVSADDYATEYAGAAAFRAASAPTPVRIDAFVGVYGKKSEKKGEPAPRRNIAVFDPADFEDFDYDLYLANASDAASSEAEADAE